MTDDEDLGFQFIADCQRKWRTDDDEEFYWVFTDCQEAGWRADVMFSHHDGDMCMGTSAEEMKGVNNVSMWEAARAAYRNAFPGDTEMNEWMS